MATIANFSPASSKRDFKADDFYPPAQTKQQTAAEQARALFGLPNPSTPA